MFNVSFVLKSIRAALYTPKVEEQTTRLSESWHLRHAQRAVSIDNISFISSAMEDRHHSAIISSVTPKENFSTLNSQHSNHSTNNFKHNHKNSNNHDDDTASNASQTTATVNGTNGRNVNGNSSNGTHNHNNHSHSGSNNNTMSNLSHMHASTDNLHKASDDEDNIIPWRAQLRKTNSRLSLIG